MLLSAEVVSAFVSTRSPFFAIQKLSFTAFATFSAVTSFFLSASVAGASTLPALLPVVFTVSVTVSTDGMTAFNTPPSFVMVLPSTFTSTAYCFVPFALSDTATVTGLLVTFTTLACVLVSFALIVTTPVFGSVVTVALLLPLTTLVTFAL